MLSLNQWPKLIHKIGPRNSKLIYSRDASGRCPLHLAGNGGHSEAVRLILSEDPETTKLFDNVSLGVDVMITIFCDF
jgi:ankyrin repeat protein